MVTSWHLASCFGAGASKLSCRNQSVGSRDNLRKRVESSSIRIGLCSTAPPATLEHRDDDCRSRKRLQREFVLAAKVLARLIGRLPSRSRSSTTASGRTCWEIKRLGLSRCRTDHAPALALEPILEIHRHEELVFNNLCARSSQGRRGGAFCMYEPC